MFVNPKNQSGFTLVETVLAMALFSFVLLIVISSVNGLYRIYRATEGIRDTQQQARTISEDITRAARRATHIAYSTAPDAICFYYSADQAGDEISTSSELFVVEGPSLLEKRMVHKFWENVDIAIDGTTACDPANPGYGDARDLTSPDVTVVLFKPIARSIIPDFQTMLSFRVRLASTRAFATEIDTTSSPYDATAPDPDSTGPRCEDGQSYCTMTSISSGVQAREKIVAGQ